MRLPWIVLGLAACSGDDSHRQVSHPVPPVVVAADATTVAPVVAPATTGSLSEEMAVSYFTHGDARDGAQQFALHNWKAARDAFALARGGEKDAAQQARIELMLGMCEEELGDAKAAAGHFAVAYKALPELSDFIGYHFARAAWLAHLPVEALDLAKKVAPDSIVGPDAQTLIGELLPAKDKAAHYRAYLDAHPNGPFRSEARFGTGDPKLLRQITIDDPLSSWTTKAQKQLEGQTVDPLTAGEKITRAMVLFDNQRNPESEAAFGDALADAADREQCRAKHAG